MLRNSTVLRRRQGVTQVIITGTYEMQTEVSKPVVKRDTSGARKALRRNMPVSILGARHLTRVEYANWGYGLKVLRMKGILRASQLTFNAMVDALVANDYPEALNW